MLVTVDELATYMDQPRFSNRQEATAEMVLAGVQSELETILRRPVEVVEVTETYAVPEDYLNGRAFYSPLSNEYVPFSVPPYSLALNNGPVVDISLVRFRPALAITLEENIVWHTLVDQIDYTKRLWGLDLYRVGANDIVEVTYEGGLDGPAIPFFKLSILRCAAREMTNQVDDVVGLKGLSTNEVQRQPSGFSVEEIAVLNRWKRKRPVG